jgi:hypothetical protein
MLKQAFAILIAIASCCHAAEPPTYLRCSEVEPGDGDGVTARVHLGFGLSLDRQPIRASNYDAWESGRWRKTAPFKTYSDIQWRAEISKGTLAKAELAGLLTLGPLYIRPNGHDPHGRLTAEFWVYDRHKDELVDVAQVMRERGHVRH